MALIISDSGSHGPPSNKTALLTSDCVPLAQLLKIRLDNFELVEQACG